MKNIIIFDFNGVIIDSVNVQKKAFYRSYKIVVGDGILPDFDKFLMQSGISIVEILKNLNLPIEMAKYYIQINRELINEICIYPGIKDMLTNLKKKDFKIVLLTGKDLLRVEELLNKFSIYDYFDLLVTSDMVKKGKPDREAYELIKRIFGSDINCAMVGDGINDLLFAKNNGIGSIVVTWGEINKEVLIKEKPDYIAEQPSDIIEFLAKYFITD